MTPIRVATELSGVEEGTHLTVAGLAENVDGYAGLRLDRPGARVAVTGLTKWPDEIHGRSVIVKGHLGWDESLPGRKVGLSGLVISKATWSIVPERGTTIVAGTQLIAAEGTRVTVEGLAGDAHASATVALIGDVVFIPQLHSWDRASRERIVRVEGRLTSSRYNDDPCPYPGAVTHSLWGRRWSIEDATWTVVDGAQP